MQDFFSFFIIQAILIAVVLSVHTYIGVHIIRRGLIFSDLALDQLAAFGVIAGIAVGIEGGTVQSYLISFAAVAVGAVLLATVKPRSSSFPREAVIGIIYCLALVASLLVADKITGGLSYVTQTLTGHMLWVTWPLVWTTVAAYIIISLFHYVFRGRIIGITDGTETENETLWDIFFFLTQGVITVLIVPIAGVLLAYSFLMIPAAIGILFSDDWRNCLAVGWIVGYGASIGGLLLSYFARLPYGPTLVLALGACFFAALLYRIAKP